MNVAMIGVAVTGDASNGAGGTIDAQGDRGAGFGDAVRNAARKHDKKPAASGQPERGKVANEDDAKASEKTPEAADAASVNGAYSNASDLLGRLMALSAQAVPAPPAAANNGNHEGGNPTGGDGSDGELEERIVISTVADLAGAGDPQAEGDKRIALRVTGMETHFEPRVDGASLVETNAPPATAKPSLPQVDATTLRPIAAATAAAATTAATAVAAETPGEVPKPRFEELLRRLNGGTVESGPDEPSTERAEPRSRDTTASAPVRDDAKAKFASPASAASRAEPAAGRAPALAAAAPEAPKAPTTGELINVQLAGRILDTLASDASATQADSPASTPSGTAVVRMVAGGAALKTLSIQLEPQNLGRVDVSMRLVDGRLTVELAASEPSTAAALAGDRHGLRKILEHAGFALDDAAITIVSRDLGQNPTPAAASPAADAGRPGAEGNRGFGSEGAGGQGRDRQRSPRDEREGASSRREGEAEPRRNRLAGAVYV